MFCSVRFPALHKTALVYQGFLYSLSSVLQAGIFFFFSWKMSFHRSYQNAAFLKKNLVQDIIHHWICICSKTLSQYVVSFTEFKIHHELKYRLRFIRNKGKNSYVFVLHNNFCSTFLYCGSMLPEWYLRKSRW